MNSELGQEQEIAFGIALITRNDCSMRWVLVFCGALRGKCNN